MRNPFKSPLACVVAYLLPRSVVGWCVVRAGVKATTGRWSSQNVTELTALEMLEREKETR